jgi:hypothetical protein
VLVSATARTQGTEALSVSPQPIEIGQSQLSSGIIA